jgi:hypothetical protein
MGIDLGNCNGALPGFYPYCSGGFGVFGVYVSTQGIVPAIAGLVVLLGIGIWIIYLVRASSKARRQLEIFKKQWIARNELDFATSQRIRAQLTLSGPPPSVAEPAAFQVRLVENLTLVEVQRHPEKHLETSITGWLDHHLGVYGWGAAVRIGNVGLGMGQIGIAGQSQVNLSMQGTITTDLLNNGLLAVFKYTLPTGNAETLRVIAPADSAIQEFLSRLAGTLRAQVIEGSHCAGAIAQLASPQLRISVSKVSDQLSMQKEEITSLGERPPLKVVGAVLSEGMMLGEAIQFADDPRWYNLFPISFCGQAKALTEEAQAALAAIPLPPVGTNAFQV